MDDTSWSAAPDVEFLNALEAAPFEHGFLYALRRLECLHQEKPRVGQSLRPREDPIRLGQEPSLAFAPATLAALAPPNDIRPARLDVRFFGLFGPNGPLPLHLTEYARERLRNADDATLARFADVFHHRLLTLFYRVWAATQPAVSLDRPETDRFGLYVAALFGLGLPSLMERDAMPDLAKKHYAGHLAGQSKHPDGLQQMLADFFQLSVRIVEFVGEWLTLAQAYRWRLGETPDTGALGLTSIVGERVWERRHKFRIVIGPIGFADYQRLLPGGTALKKLHALVRTYVGEEFNWEVNLVLKKEEVPALELGRLGHLGQTAWLNTERREQDGDDLLLQAHLCV